MVSYVFVKGNIVVPLSQVVGDSVLMACGLATHAIGIGFLLACLFACVLSSLCRLQGAIRTDRPGVG
jgi:hypothetical protein